MVISGRQPVSAGRCPPSAVRRLPSSAASNSLSLEDYKCINDDKGDTGSRRGSGFLHSPFVASTASTTEAASIACTKERPSWPFPVLSSLASAVLQRKTSSSTKYWCFPIPTSTAATATATARFLPLESPVEAVRLAGIGGAAQAESSSAPALLRQALGPRQLQQQRLSRPRQALQLRLQVGQAW